MLTFQIFQKEDSDPRRGLGEFGPLPNYPCVFRTFGNQSVFAVTS